MGLLTDRVRTVDLLRSKDQKKEVPGHLIKNKVRKGSLIQGLCVKVTTTTIITTISMIDGSE